MLDAYVRGEVAHEQMSALLMAVVWRGLAPRELSAWTGAMVASGERMDLSGTGRPVVDKHSSGGVGDKVSLVVAPLVAALGVAVPKLSGRGPRPHRRHARQAGEHPRLARRADPRAVPRASCATSAR